MFKISKAFFLVVIFILSFSLSTAYAQAPCGGYQNHYNLSRATKHLQSAASWVLRCRENINDCKYAVYELDQAAIHIWQVHLNSIGTNCWKCDPKYLYDKADWLESISDRYNASVYGKLPPVNMDQTAFIINQWKPAPYCRSGTGPRGPNPTPFPTPGPPPSDDIIGLENNKCTISFYSDKNRTLWSVNMSSDGCYVISKTLPGGKVDYRINIDSGYAPRTKPQGYVNAFGNKCQIVLDQLKRSCNL